MATDKPRGARGSFSRTSDPRVDDAPGNGSAARPRVTVPRPGTPENPLDKIIEFETTPRPTPVETPAHSPGEVAVDAAEDASADGDGPMPQVAEPQPDTVLFAPPSLPAPVEEPPAPIYDIPGTSRVGFVDLAPETPPAPAPIPTEAVPVVAPVVPAAELLDLGGHRRPSGDDGPRTETIERVLEPLARLRPEHRPVTFRRAKRPRLRRVTRVVRHVDTWSIFKVAFVFNLVLYGVCLTAGILLWNVAYSTGTIDNIENFFEQFGWESFEFRGGELYHNAWIAGLFLAVGLTGFAVLLATLFNLITDLVGGVRVTVLEEEFVGRPATRSVAKVRESQPVQSAVADAPAEPIPPVEAAV